MSKFSIVDCSRVPLVKNETVTRRRVTISTATPKTKTTRRRKVNTKVVHEFFVLLKEIAEGQGDAENAEVFDNASKDIFPKDIKYSAAGISYKKNSIKMLSPSADPVVAYDEIIKFLEDCTNIISTKALEKKRDTINAIHNIPAKEEKWSDYTKNNRLIVNVKTMIESYAASQAELHGYTEEQHLDLVCKLKLKNCAGKVIPGTFHVRDGEIIDVDNVELRPDGTWGFPPIKINKIKRVTRGGDTVTSTVAVTDSKWEKSLEKHFKKIKKNAESESSKLGTVRITKKPSGKR